MDTALTENNLSIDDSIVESNDNGTTGSSFLVGRIVHDDAVAENDSAHGGTTLVPLAVHEEEDELPAPRPTSRIKFGGMCILLLADRR